MHRRRCLFIREYGNTAGYTVDYLALRWHDGNSRFAQISRIRITSAQWSAVITYAIGLACMHNFPQISLQTS